MRRNLYVNVLFCFSFNDLILSQNFVLIRKKDEINEDLLTVFVSNVFGCLRSVYQIIPNQYNNARKYKKKLNSQSKTCLSSFNNQSNYTVDV